MLYLHLRMQFPRYLVFLGCLIASNATAQTDILPDLYGDELIEALAEMYSPDQLLSLAQAKDTLYSVIDLENDSVRCIYSGRAIHVPEGEDPSQAVFQNGQGINLEHLWPQSKGAGDGTDGQTDMHHLAPSRVDVNSMRANNIFSEVPDNQTDKWYYLNFSLMSVPGEMIDVYSEADALAFEPREDRKGDVARAMFYFYAIHNADADEAFFEEQMATLCAWHLADPVDQAEIDRSELIASYQGNVNPFVHDCTLPSRAFCGVDFNCTTATGFADPYELPSVQISQTSCALSLEFEMPVSGQVVSRLISTDGAQHRGRRI